MANIGPKDEEPEGRGTMTIPELQQEYAQTCAAVGELTYQSTQIEAELKKLFSKLKDLNQQAKKLEAKEKAKKALEEQMKLPLLEVT